MQRESGDHGAAAEALKRESDASGKPLPGCRSFRESRKCRRTAKLAKQSSRIRVAAEIEADTRSAVYVPSMTWHKLL